MGNLLLFLGGVLAEVLGLRRDDAVAERCAVASSNRVATFRVSLSFPDNCVPATTAIIPGQDHQYREEHLGDGADQGRPPGGRHRVGGHRPLHHEEVGTPIAEREHEPQPHDHAHEVDPHGVIFDGAEHGSPGVGPRPRREGVVVAETMKGIEVVGISHQAIDLIDQSVPPAHVPQPQQHHRQEAQHDEEELEHFVVNGGSEPAQVDVHQDDDGGNQQGQVETHAR